MHYYNIKLRLAGNAMNEVRKQVTSPELLVLLYIHGSDSVVDVEEIKNEKVNQRVEKDRLKELYEMSLVKREQSIDGIFGALGTLPERLPQDLIDRFNLDDEGLELSDVEELTKKILNKRNNPSLSQQQEDRRNSIRPASDVNLADLMD